MHVPAKDASAAPRNRPGLCSFAAVIKTSEISMPITATVAGLLVPDFDRHVIARRDEEVRV
jgi:hypothetical protein